MSLACPKCSTPTEVKDSRPTGNGSAIRRRRKCPSCGWRFTTFETTDDPDVADAMKAFGRAVMTIRELADNTISAHFRHGEREVERERREFPRANA
jgi:transcriptional repressor NrdR